MDKVIPGQVGGPAQYRNPRILMGVWKVIVDNEDGAKYGFLLR